MLLLGRRSWWKVGEEFLVGHLNYVTEYVVKSEKNKTENISSYNWWLHDRLEARWQFAGYRPYFDHLSSRLGAANGWCQNHAGTGICDEDFMPRIWIQQWRFKKFTISGNQVRHNVWKSLKKSHSTLRAKRATFTYWVDKSSSKMPKNGQFWRLFENLKFAVIFNRTKIGGKCQNWKILMRHF